MPIQSDRFEQLTRALRETVDRDRVNALARQASREQQEVAERYLTLFSPRKTSQTHMTTGHDHVEIAEGWDPGPVESTQRGARFSIANRSPHVNWQRFGTGPHEIWPRESSGGESSGRLLGKRPFVYLGEGTSRGYSPRLVFWLGPPLRWPVRLARFRKAGFVKMTKVNHPGFEPHGGRDFVMTASEVARPGMVEPVRQATQFIMEPLREFFRG
jgi:hypothetical protein